MAKSDFRCENCIYWVDRNIIGVCQRYPQPVNKHKGEWCGEHTQEKKIGRPRKAENDQASA